MWSTPMMHRAKEAPPAMVMSWMSTVICRWNLWGVFSAEWDGKCWGKRMILYEMVLISMYMRVVVTMMALAVKVGPT